MKRNLRTFFIVIACFIFILAGCDKASPEATSTVVKPVIETAVTTESPTVEITPTPTEAPEPIPCTIAFDSDRDGNKEIYTMAPDGSNMVNLTNNPGDDRNPVWSPDGSRIAFVSNRTDNNADGQFIYLMNSDGSDVSQLSSENWSDWPDWSNDGTQITYTANDDIYVINADGSGQSVNLTNSPEKDGRSSWSPKENLIAWVSGGESNSNIFVMNPDGTNVKQITDNGQAAGVQWTVDGRLFTGWGWKDQEQTCNNCVVNSDGSNIMDAGGKGELRRYFPFWTLDGKRVECASANFDKQPTNDIYLLGVDIPDFFMNLTNNPAEDLNPDWPVACSHPLTVIGYAGDDPSTQDRRNDFQTACNELGLICVYGDMPTLVEQKVSAIVFNSVNNSVEAAQPDIQNALDKNIPVFLLDAELDMEGAYSVTIDQRLYVETTLGWMFEKMGGEGQFAYFDLHPEYGHLSVIKDMLSKYPKITTVDTNPNPDFNPDLVKPNTSDLVKGNPELKGVWTNINFDGAIQGVTEESGAPIDKWPSLICGGTRQGLGSWMRAKELNPNFDCIAAVNPAGIAYDAVYAAYYLTSGLQINESALGGQYGHSLLVDMPVITSENLQDYLSESSQLDQKMSPDVIKENWFLK